MKNQNPIVVGLFAGAIMCAAFLLFSSLGIFILIPLMLGALPIYVACMGWGTMAGLSAVVSSSVLLTLLASPSIGLTAAMLLSVPAAIAGHQANLAQPMQNDQGEEILVWYPQGRILFATTIFVCATIILLGAMIGFDPAALAPDLAKDLKPLIPQVEGSVGINDSDFNAMIEANLRIMPFFLAAIWTGVHACNYLLGLRITRSMDVLARADEVYSKSLLLPVAALVMLAISLVGFLVTSPPLSFAFAVMCGGLCVAFGVVGLADLHWRSRNWSSRSAILFLTYSSIILFSIPLFVFTIVGLLKSGRNIQSS